MVNMELQPAADQLSMKDGNGVGGGQPAWLCELSFLSVVGIFLCALNTQDKVFICWAAEVVTGPEFGASGQSESRGTRVLYTYLPKCGTIP